MTVEMILKGIMSLQHFNQIVAQADTNCPWIWNEFIIWGLEWSDIHENHIRDEFKIH